MSKEFSIEGKKIGFGQLPFIIAEMSGNHNQSLERAMAIVDAAADAGAHAIKLQTYTADTMTMKGAFTIQDESSLWNGRELYDLYKEAYTPWEWHEPIFNHARKRGLIPFSSPFDESAVDFLETLNVGLYKIASFENTDWPLLKKVASTGKPVIMSVGVSNIADIDESVRILKDAGCNELVLLKCTSTYPATPENTNLLTIPHMRDMFDCIVGLSDHTLGIGVAVGAVAIGAQVIEKHFTLRRSDGGVDSTFSMEPEEMKDLVIESERVFQAMGSVKYGIQKAEKKSTLFKRSLYIGKDMKAGEVITPEHIRVVRPALGLPPKSLESIIGKRIIKDVKAGTPLTSNLI
ncbi:MAG: pseudaminic acid synthase [Sphingobacteriales bacterium]|nr:pseudaminic acid synthase [Sphingobacteriales bacterium]OJV97937.1 MAG: pseudaminic acid synthase [Sphingobacteriales bacterium 44-61]